ncbi:hypothetical protein KJ840_03890 [Patescibacteria group bacterium]|nr:hypothetical protein [Patescibacteria group bacterium]
MLRRRTIIIIILAAVGLSIALVLSDRYFNEPAETDLVNQSSVNQQPANLNQQNNALNQNQPAGQQLNILSPLEQSFYNTARNFAERYASFSTDSNFANLEEVKLFSTAAMINQLDQIISQGQQTAGFYGVTSKVLNVNIEELTEESGAGRALVSLQRQETQTDGQTKVFYQNLELYLIKSEDNWLVDRSEWLE